MKNKTKLIMFIIIIIVNIIISLNLIINNAKANEYKYQDNRGRTIGIYEENSDKIIIIKDNRGRQQGYIKDNNLYDNSGRKQGSYITKED